MCIQAAKTIEDEDRMTFRTDELFKIPDQMTKQFNYPEAIENTVKIAELCNVELSSGIRVFLLLVPENVDKFEYLRELC